MPVISRLIRKKAKTKEIIFKAAIELFLEKGYDQTTVDEIAVKADVAKGTFFNYFPTKDAILANLGEQRVALMEEMLANELKTIKSAKEKIYKWIKTFSELNEVDKATISLITKVVFTKVVFNMENELNSTSKLQLLLAQIIKEGQQRQEFRDNFDALCVADILISIYFFTLFKWLEGRLEDSLLNEFNIRMEIVMAGLSKDIV